MRRQRLSVTQYCLTAAIIVVAIGLYSSVHSILLLDNYIDYVRSYPPQPDMTFVTQYREDGYIATIGDLLRSAKLPLTSHDVSDHHNSSVNVLVEQLYDIRAGLIYLWMLLLVLLAGGMAWLTQSVRRPFNAIAIAIGQLAQNRLDQTVNIQGPSNVLAVSDELERLRKRLRNAEQQRLLFLRHVAHEIKTPLTSIKEGITLLEDSSLGTMNTDQREVISIVMRASHELQRSIEDLLTYNSFASAREQQVRERIELSALLENTIKKHQLTLQRSEIRIQKVLQAIECYADPKQIEAVFNNLLSNAIKYSPAKSEIQVCLRRASNAVIEFTIHDKGPGVAKEHRSSIFEAFYMGRESTNAVIKGSGLGLSLAKQYVEAHNGRIQLLDTRDGATFKVTLKLDSE